MGQYIVIMNTCPDEELAQTLATGLVDNGLAACVNILPRLTSVYCWQGRRESENEVLLFIKTRQDLYPAVQDWILEHHSYEVPEVIAVPVISGLPSYLEWIDTQTRSQSAESSN